MVVVHSHRNFKLHPKHIEELKEKKKNKKKSRTGKKCSKEEAKKIIKDF